MALDKFYLIVDASIICSYLVSQWIDQFADMKEFQGFIVKEEVPSEHLLKAREDFHKQYFAKTSFSDDFYKQLNELYPTPDKTEKIMLEKYGVSKYAVTGCHKTIFLGNNLNNDKTKEWLLDVTQDSSVAVFVCATQILKPWWIEITKSQVFNSHSAVLPYTRGMYAIENMAVEKNIDLFKKSAGVTIHYVDAGVDTGAIIKAQRITNPFQFSSIWELKAYSYMLGFSLFTKLAIEMLTDAETISAGIYSNPKLKGPNFYIKDFTLEKERQAEEGYLWMKSLAEKV